MKLRGARFVKFLCTALILSCFVGSSSASASLSKSPGRAIANAARNALPSWLTVRPGQRAYLQYDFPNNLPVATVCETVRDFAEWARAQRECPKRRAGQLVTVTAVIEDPAGEIAAMGFGPGDSAREIAATGFRLADWEGFGPLTGIRPVNGAWSGFVSSRNLKPVIPLHTRAYVLEGGAALVRASMDVSEWASWPMLARGDRVEVLQEIANTDFADIRVHVLSGSLVGRNGWVLSETVGVLCPNQTFIALGTTVSLFMLASPKDCGSSR